MQTYASLVFKLHVFWRSEHIEVIFSCILLGNKNINYVNSRGFVPPQSFTIKNILESATGKCNLGQNLQNPMCEHEQ